MSDATPPGDGAPGSAPEPAAPAPKAPSVGSAEETRLLSDATPPGDGAPGSAPESAAPAPKVPLGKPAADPRPEPNPWAAPEEKAASPGNSATAGPVYDQRTVTSFPGAGTPGTPGTPTPPGAGTPIPPSWDNPFAPPAAYTPYPYPHPQPAPGQPVPPPPFAPGGPGQPPPYAYGYPTHPPQQAFYPGAPGYGGWPGMPMAPSNGMGTAALILGIASAALFCLWPVTVVMGILGVVFGAIGRRKASRGEATNPGQALAGIICGAVGIVLAIALVVLVIVFADESSSEVDSGTDGDGFSTSLVVEHLR
ncbi:DUF4190 domain-containing protein [Streptomyces sp. NPDC093544]|uniref:DUF4190 domain-containing protein n=1 Tax=Streptomyces sp. NPDC093544 TaxID=3155200 RepID=UPI003440C92F